MVGTVNLRGGSIFRMHDARQRRRASEQPKEVDLNGKTGEDDEENKGGETDKQFLPPRRSTVKRFVPTPQAHRRTDNPNDRCEKFRPNAFFGV